jgi:hypothetical protein
MAGQRADTGDGKLMDYVAVEQTHTVELVPVQHCLWCSSTDHLLEQCADRHNLFALTWNDEKFLRECGVWYPRWIGEKFTTDPYERKEVQ